MPEMGIPISIITDLDLRPIEFATKYNIPPEKEERKYNYRI